MRGIEDRRMRFGQSEQHTQIPAPRCQDIRVVKGQSVEARGSMILGMRLNACQHLGSLESRTHESFQEAAQDLFFRSEVVVEDVLSHADCFGDLSCGGGTEAL